MIEAQVRALFTLANIPVDCIYEIPNEYWGRDHEVNYLKREIENVINGLRFGRSNVDAAPGVTIVGARTDNDPTAVATHLERILQHAEFKPDPWWLVRTSRGLIKIGWRKRVINIDWSDTNLRVIVTPDDVTKSVVMVHAWSEEKAVEYLKALGVCLHVQSSSTSVDS